MNYSDQVRRALDAVDERTAKERQRAAVRAVAAVLPSPLAVSRTARLVRLAGLAAISGVLCSSMAFGVTCAGAAGHCHEHAVAASVRALS